MAGINFDITATDTNFRATLERVRTGVEATSSSVNKAGREMDDVFNHINAGLGKIAKTAAATFTVSKALDFAKQCIEVRAQIQSLETSFATLLNSKEKADQLVGEIRKFAATTPMDMSTLAQGAQTMLGFNIAAEKVMPTLKAIGDISMGDAQKFGSLTLAFSQMSSTGKLMGQDLLQMINAGFNPLAQISEKTGKSIAQLNDEMEKGKISVEMVTSAFMDATAEGGKFHGMLAKQAEGLNGSFAYLRGTVTDFMNEAGENMESVVAGGVNLTASLVKNYKTLGDVVMGLVVTYGAYKAAVMVNAAIEMGAIGRAKALILAKKRLTAQILKLNAAMSVNPWGIAIAAAAALTYGIWKLATQQTEAEKAQARLNEAINASKKEIRSEQLQIDALFGRLKAAKQGTEEYQAAKDAIISKYGTYLKNLGDEKTALNDIAAAYKLVSEEALKAARARQINPLVQSAADDLTAQEDMTRDRVKRLFLQKFGDKKDADGMPLATTYYAKIRPVIMGEAEITDEIKDIISLFEPKTETNVMPLMTGKVGDTWGLGESGNILQGELDFIARSRALYNKKVQDIYKEFGEAPDNKEENIFDVQNASLRQLTDQLPKSIKALKDLKEATKPDKSAISAQEQELKQIRDKIDEREKELDVIEDVKSQIDVLEKQQVKYSKDDAEYKSLESRIRALKKKLPDTKKTPEQLAAEQKAAHQKYLDLLDKQAKERKNAEKENALKEKQAKIDGMADSMDKVLAQMELDFEKEQHELDMQKQAAIDAEIERQKAVFDAVENEKASKNSKYVKAVFNPKTDVDTTAIVAISAQYDQLGKLLNAKREKLRKERQDAETTAMNEFLAEYGTYLEKRNALIELRNAKIAKATTEGEKMSIAAQFDRDISDLDIKAKEKTSAIGKLFGDMSDKAVADMRKIAETAQQALDFLSSGQWDEAKGLKFGINKETFEIWSKSPEQLDKIKKAIRELIEEANAAENPFKRLDNSIKELFKKPAEGEGNKSTEIKLKDLATAASECADMVGNVAGKMAEMFEAAGNTGAADAMETTQQLMSTVSNIGKGFAEGGLVGGIAAAAGEAIGYITSAFQAAARHAAALKEIMAQTTAQQREYTLALLETALAFKEADTIFGSLDYAKAANAVDVMRDSYDKLNASIRGTGEQQAKFEKGYKWLTKGFFKGGGLYTQAKDLYSGLADIQIKTGHKKTGLFGWGKGKDIYSSILDAYPELIDKSGNFNRELAQSIINTREFSDTGKEALQHIIDLYDEAEKAAQEVKDWLTGIFGDLGNTMSDALVDAFRNGTDAAEAFGDSVESMLENIAQQMIFSTLFSGIFQDANDKMLEVMKNGSMTDEQKFKQYVSILDDMTGDVLAQQDTFNALMEDYRQAAKQRGLDLFEPNNNDTEKAATSGYSTQLSEDTGTEISGRLTAVQDSNERIAQSIEVNIKYLDSIVTGVGDVNATLTNILTQNSQSNDYLSDITDYIKKIEAFGKKLDKIISNTKDM